jgi:hypothetical protein
MSGLMAFENKSADRTWKSNEMKEEKKKLYRETDS